MGPARHYAHHWRYPRRYPLDDATLPQAGVLPLAQYRRGEVERERRRLLRGHRDLDHDGRQGRRAHLRLRDESQWLRGGYHGGSLQKVLRDYDRQADKLKEVYEKKIQERPDFNDVGFILTDYCTDFYDGKQLTIATYI